MRWTFGWGLLFNTVHPQTRVSRLEVLDGHPYLPVPLRETQLTQKDGRYG